MTVLIGGMRVLEANHGNSSVGVLTNSPENYPNDFFVNILSMDYKWEKVEANKFKLISRHDNQIKWTASRFDLILVLTLYLDHMLSIMLKMTTMKSLYVISSVHGIK